MLGRGFKIVKILTLGKQFKFLLNFRMMLDQRIGKDEWCRTLNTCMDALGVVCECGVLFSSTWLSDESCGPFGKLVRAPGSANRQIYSAFVANPSFQRHPGLDLDVDCWAKAKESAEIAPRAHRARQRMEHFSATNTLF